MGEEDTRPVVIATEALDQLANEGKLLAILDTCDAPELYAQAQRMGPAHALCLFREADEDLAKVAPYLVQVDKSFLAWLRESCWNEPWGVFLLADSRAPLGRYRKHLRKSLLVESPEGDTLYFRYYDPRVASVYLPSCSKSELEDFMGPLRAIGFVEDGHPKFVPSPS